MRALFSFDEALTPAALTAVFQVVFAFIALFAIAGAIAVLTAPNTVDIFGRYDRHRRSRRCRRDDPCLIEQGKPR